MPLIDITNPDVIKFLIESYDKTARLRMKWNSLHTASLKQAATLTREEKGYCENDVLKEIMVEGMATITRDNKVSLLYNRRRPPIRDGMHIPSIADLKKGHSIVDVGLGDPSEDSRLVRPDTDLSIDPIMRPVDSKQKEILYKSKPVFGNKVYLTTRSRIRPEDRYYFSECNYWGYGWRIKDSYFRKHRPDYGRVWRLTRDGASRSGPQPDPPHYKNSEPPGISKCDA